MPFKKGQSGNPGGRTRDKEFAEMVRLVCHEEDETRRKRKLRCLADKLYEEAMNGEGWAMSQIADRLDGKPAQESTVTLEKRDATDWSRDELVAILDDAGISSKRTAKANGRGPEPDSVH